MLPENLAIAVTDVLNFHQKREKISEKIEKY